MFTGESANVSILVIFDSLLVNTAAITAYNLLQTVSIFWEN